MKSKLAEFIKWYDTQKYAVDQAEMLVKARQLLAEELLHTPEPEVMYVSDKLLITYLEKGIKQVCGKTLVPYAKVPDQKPEAPAGLITEIEEYCPIQCENCLKGLREIISKYTPAKEQEPLESLANRKGFHLCSFKSPIILLLLPTGKDGKRFDTESEARQYLEGIEDVVSVLDLSDSTIEKHGPLGTPPAQLVKEVLDEKDMIIKMLKNGMKCIESNPAKEQEPLAVLAERKGYCKTTAFHTVVGTWWILLSDCYGKEWTSSPQSNPTNYTLQEAESKARKYLESIPDVDNGNNV